MLYLMACWIQLVYFSSLSGSVVGLQHRKMHRLNLQGGSYIWSLTDTCRVFPTVSRDYLILKRPSRGLTFQKVSECFVTSIRGFTTLRRSVQVRWWILLCQCVLRLPFVVSVPLKLWCGHGGGVTLQCAHAAHLSLWALGLLYCRRICGVT